MTVVNRLVDVRWGPFRRLVFADQTGIPFLVRTGIDARWFGIYVHRLLGPDRTPDRHDHPWPFVTFVLWGGYTEYAGTTDLSVVSECRVWGRWSVHRMRLTDCHRIVGVRPGTVSLVVTGRRVRGWGFHTAEGWVGEDMYSG